MYTTDKERQFYLRIKKIISSARNQKISYLVILKDENIFYLTGFYGKDSRSILLITEKEVYLLVHFNYFEQAKIAVKNLRINIVCYHQNKFEKLSAILEGYSLKSIGVEGKNISFTDFSELKKLLFQQGKKLVSADGLVESLRIIKDKQEISKIKKACKITDKAYLDLINSKETESGRLTEVELALYLEKLLIKNGAYGRSFDIITAFDKNSSMPHYLPQKKALKNGIILIDFGCRYKNYCSDITRTLFTGNDKICNEFKKIYDIVLEAQLKAIDVCREGITCRELDGEARKFISSRGYGSNFGHGLGHGVGLEVHEEPVINKESDTILKENMIITIEPGIYVENYCGVRIEDMVLVKKNSCEVLFSSKKNFL